MSASPAGAPGFTSPVIVVMGVTACGKTTVGEGIAERLDIPFADGDDLHPRANVEKMASGHALTDEDRWPWLEKCGEWLANNAETGGVIGCSALRVVYRDVIRRHVPGVFFAHLHGPQEVAVERVAARKGHFMPTTLVQSQYDTLEALEEWENGMVVRFDLPVDTIVDTVVARVAQRK
ncbi:gluconokinase [Blastococcus sp. Marseille-P5729]|uniref:gluconokinase n=1 Tax=Blastococcus sp. Marseille-P5729 TaxID=2086582 RepID=UPI000D0FA835|nr:gluconokinase [Blastococcus sp. Marseille-P5729]